MLQEFLVYKNLQSIINYKIYINTDKSMKGKNYLYLCDD